MIYTDVTENKMCLTDICGAAPIKPGIEAKAGKKPLEAWLSRAARNGNPPSGVTYPANLTLTSLNLNGVQMHCYIQEWGEIAWLICVISGPTFLTGNYVRLCSVIFSCAHIYDLELIKIKVT